MICQMVLEQVYYKIDIMGKFQDDFFIMVFCLRFEIFLFCLEIVFV